MKENKKYTKTSEEKLCTSLDYSDDKKILNIENFGIKTVITEDEFKKISSSENEKKKFLNQFTSLSDSQKEKFFNNIKESFEMYSLDFNNEDMLKNIFKDKELNDKDIKEELMNTLLEQFPELKNNHKILNAINSVKSKTYTKTSKENIQLDDKNTKEFFKDILKEFPDLKNNKLFSDILGNAVDISEDGINNDKEIKNYIKKCQDKLKEIRELSKDFEHIIKNDYHKDCDNIEYRLNNCNDNNIEELNKIADEINTLYRNAYNKKNNKSSLYYVMDIEDDDIDLIDHI